MFLLRWIEKLLRFWFPHAFVFDEDDPEPVNHKERKQWKKKRKLNKKLNQSKAQQTKTTATLDDDKYKSNYKKPDVDLKATTGLLQKNQNILDRGDIGIEIIGYNQPLTDVCRTLQQSGSHVAHYYHDSEHHQLAVKFNPDSSRLFYIRDDVKRKKLKPLLFPLTNNEPFDRTHIIPVGYHGSENDERLVVGFSSRINREDLYDFEIYVAEVNKNKTILWFVDIEKQRDGSAIWHATVWDEQGDIIAHDDFHDEHEFVWKN